MQRLEQHRGAHCNRVRLSSAYCFISALLQWSRPSGRAGPRFSESFFSGHHRNLARCFFAMPLRFVGRLRAWLVGYNRSVVPSGGNALSRISVWQECSTFQFAHKFGACQRRERLTEHITLRIITLLGLEEIELLQGFYSLCQSLYVEHTCDSDDRFGHCGMVGVSGGICHDGAVYLDGMYWETRKKAQGDMARSEEHTS